MKKIIKVLFLYFFFVLNQGYSQSWQWADHLGSSYNQYSERGLITTDGSNVYMIGSYSGTLDLGFDTIYGGGGNDIMMAKFDGSGNGIWAKTLGSGNNLPYEWEDANGIYDPIGNCLYVAGNFYQTINFGSNLSLTSIGGSDVFLAKFNLNGNCIWAKRAGGIADDNARLYVSPNGLPYLVAETKDSANFGSLSLPSGGCIAKYDTSGNCLWASYKYNLVDSNSLKLGFINDDLLLYGSFRSALFILDTASIQNFGDQDIFVARADSNANVKWIKHYGESGWDVVNNLAIDGNNNIYSLISFQNIITIDGNHLTSSGNGDMVWLKFDQNGILTSYKQISSNGYVYPICTKCDNDGNLYVSGFLNGNVNFDSFSINSSNPYELFLTRFDADGNILGLKNIANAQPTSIEIDNFGNVFCAGGFQNIVTIGLNTFSSLGSWDIFIAKTGSITGIVGEGRITKNKLVIYANPNKGTFNIKVPDEIKSFKQAWLYVYDVSGKEIARFNLDNESDTPHFDISNSNPGSYSVKLVQGEKVYSGKMVVE